MFHRPARRTAVLSLAAVAAFGALSGSATAVPAAAVPHPAQISQWQGDPYVSPLTCRNGHVQIAYRGTPLSDWDWFGLYDELPNRDDWSEGLVSGQWQWATSEHMYQTSARSGEFTTAYWTWDDDTRQYELISTRPLELIFCDI
jgi:hypothetical protein